MKKLICFLLFLTMIFTTLIDVFPPLEANAATEKTPPKRYTVLVLDTSGTVSFTSEGEEIYVADPALENVKKASKHFLKSIASAEGENYVAVVSYQEKATIVSNFSKNTTEISKKIDALTADNRCNISAGLDAANDLINSITDTSAIKNVILCTTGLTWTGGYTYEGKYDDNVDGASWKSAITGIHIYAYANYALKIAEKLKENASLYVLGLFQTLDKMPNKGIEAVRLFQKTAQDLATSKSHYHIINDIDNIDFVFGELAETITNNITGTFKYRPGTDELGTDSTGTYFYSDSYFSKPSTYYSSINISNSDRESERLSSLYSFATMSLCLEMATFASLDATKEGKYESQSQNARQLLSDIGFVGIQTNDEFQKKPSQNSIGVIIGQKRIIIDGEEYTVLAVAVRGGGYEAEWAGNFNIGEGNEKTEICKCTISNCDGNENHLGFYEARNQAVNAIKHYIEDNNVTGKVKLWVTGYSRGGATSGLVGKWFDDHLSETNTWNIKLTFDDIYAFTFEAPMSTDKSNLEGKNYSNIFNILSPSDLIPKVAMSGNVNNGWNFARPGDIVNKEDASKYGNNIILPTKQNTSNYKKLKELMKENLNELDDRIPFVVDAYKDHDGYIFKNTPLNEAMDYFMNEVAQILSKDKYHTYLEQTVEDMVFAFMVEEKGAIFFENLLVKIAESGIKHTIEEILSELSPIQLEFKKKTFGEELLRIIKESIIDSNIKYTESELDAAFNLLWENLGDLIINEWDLIWYVVAMFSQKFYQSCNCDCLLCLCKNKDVCNCEICLCLCKSCTCNVSDRMSFNVFTTHYPDYCLAWLMALDSNYQGKNTISFSQATRVIHINCPVNVTIFDENGQVAAEIIDDVLQNPDEIDLYIFVRDGEKVIYLPMDGKYTISITATGNATMSYLVEEYSILNGEISRSIAYLDIPITTGKTFEATVPKASISSTTSSLSYPLSAEGVALTPNIDATENRIETAKSNVTVQVDGEQGGRISGDGEYLIGTRAHLETTLFDCYSFNGWYLGEEKLSDELQYSFVVKENVSIVAKFTQKHTPNDDDGDCSTAISCSVCSKEIIAAKSHDFGNSFEKHCQNKGCDVINPKYKLAKSTGIANFIDSIADNFGVTSTQFLVIIGVSLSTLAALIIFGLKAKKNKTKNEDKSKNENESDNEINN